VTNSRVLANLTGRNHKDVLRLIENRIEAVDAQIAEVNGRNIAPVDLPNTHRRPQHHRDILITQPPKPPALNHKSSTVNLSASTPGEHFSHQGTS